MLNILRNLMGGGSSEGIGEALRAGATIVDVRSPMEFRGGHVAGSKNIPLPEVEGWLAKQPKSASFVFCCASGGRSGSATSLATSKGYTAINGGPWTSVNRAVADMEGAK